MYAYQPTSRHRRRSLTLVAVATLLGACDQNPVATATTPVDNRPLLQVTVSPASTQMRVGDTLVLRAEVRDRYGYLVPDLVPEWESNATAIVIVSPDGVHARVIGIGAGEARVMAITQGVTGAASVSVAGGNAPPQP